MRCQSDIENLAQDKLLDAECLLENGRYDSAYYLAGYCVELLLKARVCKTLGIDNFFDFKGDKFKAKNVDTFSDLTRCMIIRNYCFYQEYTCSFIMN